jgi:hypothetical protein
VRHRGSVIRRAIACAAVIAAGATATTACVPPPAAVAPAPAAPVPPPRPPRVDVFGDSVVLGGNSQIVDRLHRDGWAPRVNAVPGVSIEQVANLVVAQPRVSDVAVVALGYTYFWKPVVLRRDVDALMYAFSIRNVRRVIWLNVRENRPERRDVNLELNAATQRWGNLEIADWNSLSRGRTGVFLPDGQHLLPAGGRLMARLIEQRLDAYRAHAPRVAVPRYGVRVRAVPAVSGYGGDDVALAAQRASQFVSRSPLVDVASTADGAGYWLVRRDGTVRAFIGARWYGGTSGVRLARPIVAMAPTPSGGGYWLTAADGGVFAFGDARFYGSTGAIRLAQPSVAMAATPSGGGYWLTAADGGVFAFGDARFYGSTGAIPLAEPIVGMAARPDGRGYWLVSYDGGVFAFGAARFRGSGATTPRYWKIVDVAAAPGGDGYWLLAANGEVIPFGAAADAGWKPSLSVLYVAIAARPSGYWLLAQGPPVRASRNP